MEMQYFQVQKYLFNFPFIFLNKTFWHTEYNNLNTSRLNKHHAWNILGRGLDASSQYHASATLTLGKNHGSRWIDGCVSLVWMRKF
jgi:hypothetical protein